MAIYLPNPRCPECGAEIDIDDTYDHYYDDESLVLQRVGHCTGKNCGLDYQWESSWTLVQGANTDLRKV